jgi:hypothetical protein
LSSPERPKNACTYLSAGSCPQEPLGKTDAAA